MASNLRVYGLRFWFHDLGFGFYAEPSEQSCGDFQNLGL